VLFGASVTLIDTFRNRTDLSVAQTLEILDKIKSQPPPGSFSARRRRRDILGAPKSTVARIQEQFWREKASLVK